MRELNYENLTDTIRKYIKDNNLTNDSFAKKVGMSRRTLQYLFKGKGINSDYLFAIFKLIEYDPYYSKKEK